MTLPKLRAKGLRTVREIRAHIPIGGSCWVIYANPHTKEPKGVEEFIRVDTLTFRSAEASDEERIHEHKTSGEMLKQPYGGAWLRKRDAVKYFKLLEALWKRVSEVIDSLAQEHEQYSVR
jgi:hypothetical protein